MPVLYDDLSSAMNGPTGRSKLMESQAWLNTDTGFLTGTTVTRNLNWAFGFTGHVGVILFDAGGAPLQGLPDRIRSFGVDARGAFWSQSTRVDQWQYNLDPNVTAQAVTMMLVHSDIGVNRLRDIIRQLEEAGETIEEIITGHPEWVSLVAGLVA